MNETQPIRFGAGRGLPMLLFWVVVAISATASAQEGPTQPPEAPEPPPKETVKSPRPEPASVTAATPTCREHGDKLGDAFDRVVKPLIDEANRREEKTLDAGQTAFEAIVAAERPTIAAIRAAAAATHATLTAVERAACEEYAYRRIAKSFARFGPAAGIYSGRVGIFRALGSLFVF